MKTQRRRWMVMIATLAAAPVLIASAVAGAQTTESVREIEVVVDHGYQPSRIEVRPGERVRLRFIRRDYGGCTREVVFPSLNLRRELPTGQPVVIDLPVLPVGETTFQCGMNMIRGSIVVAAGSDGGRPGGRGGVERGRDDPARLAAVTVGCAGLVPAVQRTAMEDPVMTSLLAARDTFVGFLRRRLGDSAAVEDILQDAYARGVQHRDELRAGESSRAWFYRILRNAVIDHRRRNASMGRSLDALAAELAEPAEAHPALKAVPCPCVVRLADEMKPAYADALRRVTVEGVSVKDFAAAEGITANNAAVRVFRAREALRQRVRACCGACADAGCADCTCAQA